MQFWQIIRGEKTVMMHLNKDWNSLHSTLEWNCFWKDFWKKSCSPLKKFIKNLCGNNLTNHSKPTSIYKLNKFPHFSNMCSFHLFKSFCDWVRMYEIVRFLENLYCSPKWQNGKSNQIYFRCKKWTILVAIFDWNWGESAVKT